MVEPCGFGIGKTCLPQRQDRTTLPVTPNSQADPAFMTTLAGFAVVPGPAQFNRFTRRDTEHFTRDTMPPVFRFDHHR